MENEINISRIEVPEQDIGIDIKESSTSFLKGMYLSGCNKRFYSLSLGQKRFHREIVTELRIRGYSNYMDEADSADYEHLKFRINHQTTQL